MAATKPAQVLSVQNLSENRQDGPPLIPNTEDTLKIRVVWERKKPCPFFLE